MGLVFRDTVIVMQWKLVIRRAWAEAQGWSDSEFASLFDIARESAQPAGAGDLCPRCRNHPNDSMIQFFMDERADTPEQVKGRVIVRCLCGTTYWYDGVHAIDARQPVGEMHVRAASAFSPVVPSPSPVRHDQIMLSNDVVLRDSYRYAWHPAYNMQPSPAPQIWAAVEAAKRASPPDS